MGGKHTVEYRESPQTAALIQVLNKQLEQRGADYARVTEQLDNLNRKLEEERKQRDAERKLWEQQSKDLTDKMTQLLQENKVETFADLEALEQRKFSKILDLVRALPPMPCGDGIQIGFIGLSGVGKSSLINKLLGVPICKVGRNQTTLQLIPRRTENSLLTYWDVPGQTDEIRYISADFIALIKRLDFVGVVIDRTPGQMSRLMKLLQEINVPYSMIVNKLDLGEEEGDDLQAFKQTIEAETQQYGVRPSGIFYISAKKPENFDFQLLRNTVGTTERRV